MITAERLRELLEYNPQTGAFVRRKTGKVLCALDKSTGYYRACFDGRQYYHHRLAVLYMTGDWPPQRVDHRNLIKTDNRWENIRCASHWENVANKPMHKRNKAGMKGVVVSPNGKSFRAYGRADGRTVYLGNHPTPEAAHAAYCAFTAPRHGEFFRPK